MVVAKMIEIANMVEDGMDKMRAKNLDAGKWIGRAGLGLAAAMALAACASNAPPVTKNGGEQIFATPDEAINAFVAANRTDNKPALLRILGPQGAKLVSSGDPVADRTGRNKFLTAYDAAHELESDGDNKDVLVVGPEEWPMPIPLVRSGGGWHFDTAAGEEEVLDRRIGRNELVVIEICRTYVEAQREYAEQHPRADGKAEYAQKFVSDTGKHDGLYWPTKPGEEESPFGPLIADARAEGYVNAGKHVAPTPYHGYYFKILKRQGPDAADGTRDYIVHGHMTGGFAMLAFPATYGDSGVMSFIVDQNGIVYEKNLGSDTAKIAAHIVTYNPDKGWKAP
jgi:hypothetical protein